MAQTKTQTPKINLGQIVKTETVKVDLGQVTNSKTKKAIEKPEPSFLSEMEKFEKYLRYEKRYSTYNVFQQVLLAKRIATAYKINRPCMEDAYQIEDDLRSREIKNSTIKHYLRTLELMAEFKGIALKVRKPKPIYAIPKSLNKEEARQLLDACNNLRDKAMISVLLYCGLRAKEITSLYKEDVDLDKRLLQIKDRGTGIKNRHERKAVLSTECAKDLKNWLNTRPNTVDSDYLFVTVNGKKISNHRLNMIVKKLARKCCLDPSISTHKLRHTCASNLLKSGIPLTEVSLQLGHRNLTSTMVYLHGSVEELKDSIDTKFKY